MTVTENKRNEYIDLIKFFACIFITNSHCMYANPLFKLGGGWGNAIFFATTGFLLGGIQLEIVPWLLKRWKRIVPITFIMTVVAMFIYGLKANTIYGHVTRFWFVIALLIYYIPFYIVDRTKHGYKITIGLHILVYTSMYILLDKSVFFVEGDGFSIFKVYFYFIVMLLGGLVKKYFVERLSISPMACILSGGIGFAIWFAEYYCIKVKNIFLEYQFFIHVGISIFGISVLIWAIQMYKKYSGWRIPKLVKMISESTLEVYLIQIVILPIINHIIYPMSILLFWIVAIIGGVLLRMATNRINGRIK